MENKEVTFNLGLDIPPQGDKETSVMLLGNGRIKFYELGFPDGVVTDLRATLELVKSDGSRYSLEKFFGDRKYFVADDKYFSRSKNMPFEYGDHLVLRAWNLDAENDYILNCSVTCEYARRVI